ncbi:MAG: hypothetical protein ACRDLN_15610 [Solirubrobacteraceae bacterium]
MSAARTLLLPLALASCLLAACGGDDSAKGPPGSESNPLVALPNPSATRTPPTEEPPGEGARGNRSAASKGSAGAKTQHSGAGSGETGARPATPRRQKALPPSATRPCSLVSKAQARVIVGAPIVEPLEAPQGPTCIYQTKSGKPYITLAVQTVSLAKLRKQIRREQPVAIAGRTAYCGTYGKPMLFLPVASGRVLSITAPCGMARRFAAQAASHL